jgi:hypothetical protein
MGTRVMGIPISAKAMRIVVRQSRDTARDKRSFQRLALVSLVEPRTKARMSSGRSDMEVTIREFVVSRRVVAHFSVHFKSHSNCPIRNLNRCANKPQCAQLSLTSHFRHRQNPISSKLVYVLKLQCREIQFLRCTNRPFAFLSHLSCPDSETTNRGAVLNKTG